MKKSKTSNNEHRIEAAAELLLFLIPKEIHVIVLSYLRAYDLAFVQQTCRFFNCPELITRVILHTASHIYPPELTDGFDHIVQGNPTPKDSHGNFTNYEPMKNIETLVVARVLARPEPPLHERKNGYYVSKAWCKTALQWLESQQDLKEQQLLKSSNGVSKKKNKREKKKSRIRSRRLSNVSPPWPNVNHDLTCEHGDLRHCSSKSARARRRVLDKQAWKMLKKLYPDSVQLRASLQTGCLQCALDAETEKKNLEAKKEEDKLKRMQPLSNPVIRAIYTRANKGVPLNALRHPQSYNSISFVNQSTNAASPLKPGIYSAIPRSWCHKWRKYLKNGGEKPSAPDGSSLLCDAHKLPLIPNHLEAFLYGESQHLLSATSNSNTEQHQEQQKQCQSPVATIMEGGNRTGYYENDETNDITRATIAESLAAAGFRGNDLDMELEAQRLALLGIQNQRRQQGNNQANIVSMRTPERNPRPNNGMEIVTPSSDNRNNDILDKENQVVVEILTEDECTALEEWWPDMHSSFVLKFAITDGDEITWSTTPCRECYARHCETNIVVRNRSRKFIKKTKK